MEVESAAPIVFPAVSNQGNVNHKRKLAASET